jgi:hypothetical protein
VQRLLGEVTDLRRDISNLEGQLESSGSARTADDVQGEIQILGEKMWVHVAALHIFNTDHSLEQIAHQKGS